MNKNNKNKKGFTLVELIAVIAILGIMGAVFLPSIGNITAKSKISTDISTVKTIKRLIDVYNAEGNIPAMATTDNAAKIGEKLFSAGYLESETIKLQTKGDLVYTAATLSLDVTGSSVPETIKTVAGKMVKAEAPNAEWINVPKTE